jgi:viroplasmin and RNaseH domain-containing protein
MAKNKEKVKKVYAIKVGNGVNDIIVQTWEECKGLTDGYNSVYKSFSTQEEAVEFLGTVDAEKVRAQTTFMMEKKKKIKENTLLVQARVPKATYSKYAEKCNENGWEIGEGIIKLIEEWVN